ncbi:hypothetical protein EIN_182010 [Entamoeba invadens IP1]|uniref:hypothetical protein n=1 Tax=Entamoeba invadens IP1 TaxID=370355 RepID=UPI0002C3D2EA|nr:hypothetical protein EIN_182010 [Entamoeba invadens IP1]ELP94004.1 hypothetical protein EIN_182010 [Entamoeba invadens IP1]|eukprot:XP_004260775.1 hypothetical protein EIN_182010 [Entamoeba invadens IP1]
METLLVLFGLKVFNNIGPHSQNLLKRGFSSFSFFVISSSSLIAFSRFCVFFCFFFIFFCFHFSIFCFLFSPIFLASSASFFLFSIYLILFRCRCFLVPSKRQFFCFSYSPDYFNIFFLTFFKFFNSINLESICIFRVSVLLIFLTPSINFSANFLPT